MTYQLYSPPKDRTTRTGGECNLLAWADAKKPTYLQMVARLTELNAAPLTERNNFWQGQRAELMSMLVAAEDEIWKTLEGEVA